MIIILTNGTKASRDNLLQKLNAYIEYTLINHEKFAEQRHITETLASQDKNLVVTRCFLKSQRYEIYCIAKRFNQGFCIVQDSVQHDDFEELTGNYDKPVINDDSLEEILNVKKVKSINKAHKFIRAPTSDYLTRVRKIMEEVGSKIEGFWCKDALEKKVFRMIGKNPIDVDQFEKWYKAMIINELSNKN